MDRQRTDFRFFHRLRVRWAEVDMQKIVFNAHYLMYMDTAIADYWRALALPYESALAQLEGDLFVKKACLEYHASARYDDTLDIGMRRVRVGKSSIVFEGAVFCGDRLLVGGELVYVFADPHSQTSKPVPDALRQIFDAFEQGMPVVSVRHGGWDVLGDLASALREDVFVQEQGIGAHMVWDTADHEAVHCVVCNGLGQPVGAGRLVQQAPSIGRIGRMAVSKVLRGTQLGRQVLFSLVDASRARGDREVMLHAQLSAQGFYDRLGFVARGPAFEEAGIGHIEMVLPLASESH
jgi:YbgC/YbaW family acyl-CoA thioester hydrolase